MSLPLRITFEGNTYTILTKLINKDTNRIKIRLNDEDLMLFKNGNNEWDALERTINDNTGLISAVVRNVRLRYRL